MRKPVLVAASVAPVAVLMLCAATAAPPRAKPAAATFERDVAPLMTKYCTSCHGKTGPSADLSLVGYKNTASVLKARAVWENVSRNVSAGHMPPSGMPQPTPAERDRIVAFFDATFSQADCKIDDPGRVTLRRLNREEYNNTIRDLLGVQLRPGDDFPSDDVGYGFDNIGDVLSISPLLMEKYLEAAEKVAQAAILSPEGRSKPARWAGGGLAAAGGQSFGPTDGRMLGTEAGEVGVEHTFPADGEYVLRAGAWGQQAGPQPVRMALRFDGNEVQKVDVPAVQDNPGVYPVRVKVSAGKHRFAVAFLNNYRNPDAPDPKDRDRNLVIDFLEIQGPLGNQTSLPASHRRLIPKQPTAATRSAVTRAILSDFARRAYRRPVTKDEVDRLCRYADLARKEGESFERGIQLAVQAVLVSPHFLFRVEVDPKPGGPNAKHLVGNYELASRLSYFLWSSMPDDELFALAAKGTLRHKEVLRAQVRRMLVHPKARALTDNFAAQWLHLRSLADATPDPERFPTFDETLRAAMRRETELFFETIVREDRSVLEFLDARYTFLNEPLARHYGNTRVRGNAFRRVALAGGQRGGLLTQASILTVTSNPTRTSPVKRGKWVLEQIFGTPPPPPPPGAGELAEEKKGALSGTIRQRLEQHRADPACASCHQRMDPIGFGLENYDAIGAWRMRDGQSPIDASGELAGGKKFEGPVQLKKILLEKKALFVRSLSERMLTYALGRGVESFDKCHVDEIAAAVTKNDYRFSSLVFSIVESDPFRKRRGDTASKGKQAL